MTGVPQLAATNVIIEGIDIFVEKRRLSGQHLKQYTADPVNIRCESDTLSLQHFGREVCWAAAERPREALLSAEAEIGEPHKFIRSNEDVLWLEIAVENVPAVEVLQGQDHLRNHEAGSRL